MLVPFSQLMNQKVGRYVGMLVIHKYLEGIDCIAILFFLDLRVNDRISLHIYSVKFKYARHVFLSTRYIVTWEMGNLFQLRTIINVYHYINTTTMFYKDLELSKHTFYLPFFS